MGAVFIVPGYVLHLLGAIWGLFICLGIVHAKLGLLGVLFSLFFFPVALYLAPWYVGFVDGNWLPVKVIYGSGVGALILIGVGSMFNKR